MILPDVNILVHAVNADSPKNDTIRSWWDTCLNGVQPVVLPWVVILGFIRITTNPRIFGLPLSVEEATHYIREWIGKPSVRIITPTADHWELMENLLRIAGTAGNLTTDAHLAALAMQWDCTLYSTDTDFARFKGLKWKQP